MKIMVVVPAYNEASRLGPVLFELVKHKLKVVVVDDGSTDHTFEKIKQYPVTALRHRINLGKGAALKTGCDAAFEMGAEAVIMMDSDGQHRIEDLAKFVDKLNTGKFDLIFGSRNLGLGQTVVRFFGNKFASVLVSLFYGIYVSDLLCGYRAFTKQGYKKIYWESDGYGVETEMVINAGKHNLRTCEVPVETIYYDKFKGVTILDAFGILFNVLRWKFFKS